MVTYKIYYKNLGDKFDVGGIQPIYETTITQKDIFQIRSLFYKKHPRSVIIREIKI